jgi:hypothetical protein
MVKSLVIALGFLIVAGVYLEHSISEVKKAISFNRDGPLDNEPKH